MSTRKTANRKMIDRMVTIVKADAGYAIALKCRDATNEPFEVWEEPIIAWEIVRLEFSDHPKPRAI